MMVNIRIIQWNDHNKPSPLLPVPPSARKRQL